MEPVGIGRRSTVLALDDERVLKPTDDPDREARHLEVAAAAGISVPTPLGATELDGGPALLMTRVHAPSHQALLEADPTRLRELGTVAGRVHAGLHEAPGTGLPDLRALLTRRLELLGGRLAEGALARLADLPDGGALLHGDFHPGNLLGLDPTVVVDWPDATRGCPEADVARTELLIGCTADSTAPGPLSEERRAFREAHRTGYRERRRLDDGLVASWAPVMAAVRLDEGIDEQVDWLRSLAAIG